MGPRMPIDYTLCVNGNCPLRQDCFRCRAPGDDSYQSYANFPYDAEIGSDCNYFISKKDISRRQRVIADLASDMADLLEGKKR